MKLYSSMGPNPAVVNMFLAQKGASLDTVKVDLMAGENRQPPYMEKNPAGQLPCLEMDDGGHLSEIIPICEYLDEKLPGPSLIGATAEERAQTRMWVRRIDLNICEPMANGFRFAEGLKMFEKRIHCIPEAAPGLKATAQEKLAWLDKLMEGKQFIAGDRFTLADVLLFCFVDFFAGVGQPIDPALKNIVAWHARVKARPSASA